MFANEHSIRSTAVSDGNVTHVASICSQVFGMQSHHQSQDSSTECLVKMANPSKRRCLTHWMIEYFNLLVALYENMLRYFSPDQCGWTNRKANIAVLSATSLMKMEHQPQVESSSAWTRQGCSVSKHSHHAYKVVHLHLLELRLHQHTIIGGKGCSPAHTIWLTGDLWAVCCRNMTAPNASPSPHNPRHPTPEL